LTDKQKKVIMPVPLQAVASSGAVVENLKRIPSSPETVRNAKSPGNPQDPYYFQYF
jgi:hypothetical protein